MGTGCCEQSVLSKTGLLHGFSATVLFCNIDRICLSVYLNVGNAITRLSTRLSVDQFGQNLGGRISSPPRHVRHDVVTMAPAVP